MKFIKTAIDDIIVFEPDVYVDDRGFFLESYNARNFVDVSGFAVSFVQDNHSHSRQHVLRGLHYQLSNPQGKLIRVIQGEVYDVAVDLRRSSRTFGRWVGITLSSAAPQAVWIPPGFAHGFLVLSDSADVLYKTTDFYDPNSERCLRWDDPQLNIAWPLTEPPLLSKKDRNGRSFSEADLFS